MQPMDLGCLRELAGHALGCIAQALTTATAAQRDLLLKAMNALDDIEALAETPFDISAAFPAADSVGTHGLYALPMAEIALVA